MPDLPVDPDIDLHDPADAASGRAVEWGVVAAVAAGGVLGAEARYGLGVLAPHSPREFPWMTLAVNVAGCLLIGLLMGLLAQSANAPRLARPLLGTGVLGGFTTFSTFSVDVDTLANAGRWGLAGSYLLATVLLCVGAVVAALGVVSHFGRAP